MSTFEELRLRIGSVYISAGFRYTDCTARPLFRNLIKLVAFAMIQLVGVRAVATEGAKSMGKVANCTTCIMQKVREKGCFA